MAHVFAWQVQAPYHAVKGIQFLLHITDAYF
jgi:hypothetical protein